MEEHNTVRKEADNEEVEIDLGRLMAAIGKHIGVVIVLALVCAIVTAAVNFFVIEPTYRSSFTAYVNNHSREGDATTLTSGDTSAAQSLAYTYAAIMSSRSVLVDAAKDAGLDYEYDDLKDFVTTEVQNDTQLVNVYVTMKDPKESYAMAKAIEEVAPDYVSDIVDGSSMKIVTEAQLPDEHYTPHRGRNTAIGAILGALVAIIIVVVMELSDTRVKSEDQLEEQFGISIVGTIPDFAEAADGDAHGYGYYGHSSKKKGGKS